MSAYLFVHFKEKETPDGEQVYFGLSKNGFDWEQVNGGQPVLWSNIGEQGVRDHTIIRSNNGRFYILSTDLSLANSLHAKYKGSWSNILRGGSKCLVLWESDNLVEWSEPKLIKLGDEDFGCLWAPDILFDKEHDDYVIHWSSCHASNNYGDMAIYYTRTKDFIQFEKPQILCRKDGSTVIDSAIYEENGLFHRFLKSGANPHAIILQQGNTLTGEYVQNVAFDAEMAKLGNSSYEGPTAFKLHDGKWCLMLDYFGVKGEEQGYIPFIADDIRTGKFVRSNEQFSFPYNFKHGTVLAISTEEYDRIQSHYC